MSYIGGPLPGKEKTKEEQEAVIDSSISTIKNTVGALLPDPTNPTEVSEFMLDLYSDIRITKNPIAGSGLFVGKKLLANSPEVSKAVKAGQKIVEPIIEKGKEWLDDIWDSTLFKKKLAIEGPGPDVTNWQDNVYYSKGTDGNVNLSKGTGGSSNPKGSGEDISKQFVKDIVTISPEYERVVTFGMEKMGMKDNVFDLKLYDANSNILNNIIDPYHKGKLLKDGTYTTRKLGKRHWMEYFLSPESLKGDFEYLQKQGKLAANETWEGFLKTKGLSISDIQLHHKNPLHDSLQLFDGIKWNSDEYWDVIRAILERGTGTGMVHKGEELTNVIQTYGKATLKDTPHGIAHAFYKDIKPVFFSEKEIKAMKGSHKIRIEKAKRWAGIVNRSEEILLEAHKAWESLNPKTRMDFNDLVETMSKYDDKGIIKGIHDKYQVKDIQKMVKDVEYDDFIRKLEELDAAHEAAWMQNLEKEFIMDIIENMSKKDLQRKWGKKYNLKQSGMKQLDLFLNQ
tara:strand:- start:41 stop:1570 length:1530 start_codon:yes stop_codon:yes gene_type:complete